MKALTICQPYADLIASGEKWIENRTWPTKHRGLLCIHAGKSNRYLNKDELQYHQTGCIVAVAVVTRCVDVAALKADRESISAKDSSNLASYDISEFSTAEINRILRHKYCEGPYGFILDKVVKLPVAVTANGKQGLWELTADQEFKVQYQLNQIVQRGISPLAKSAIELQSLELYRFQNFQKHCITSMCKSLMIPADVLAQNEFSNSVACMPPFVLYEE